MQLLTTKHFNGYALDCYIEPEQEDRGDFWATREQIGRLLEYENPEISVANIHNRHSERLDKFSTLIKLIRVEGGREVSREVTVYSFKGLLEICRYSNQPKADAVMDWLWDVADEIRRTGAYSIGQKQSGVPAGVIDGAKAIFEAAHIEDNQLALGQDLQLIHWAQCITNCRSSSDSSNKASASNANGHRPSFWSIAPED